MEQNMYTFLFLCGCRNIYKNNSEYSKEYSKPAKHNCIGYFIIGVVVHLLTTANIIP